MAADNLAAYASYTGFIQEPTRNVSVAVGLTSVVISEARAAIKRKDILVRNISAAADRISVNIGFQTATANQGVILEQGESFQLTSQDGSGNDIFQGVISAICATANGTLSIFER